MFHGHPYFEIHFAAPAKDKKLQYYINREAAKISKLSSGTIEKYVCLSAGEILPSDQRRMIEKVKFGYSSLRKVFEKRTKAIEDEGKKQIKALEEFEKQLIKSGGEKNSLENSKKILLIEGCLK